MASSNTTFTQKKIDMATPQSNLVSSPSISSISLESNHVGPTHSTFPRAIIERVNTTSTKYKDFYCNYAYLSNNLCQPSCYTYANKEKCWIKAMTEEMEAIMAYKTWTLVPKGPSMNIVGSKWV